MRAEIVFNEASILLRGRKRILIVADLHLGLVDFYDEELIKKVNEMAERFDADELIVLGDLKHSIGRSRRVERILEDVNVPMTLVRGNHDGKLKGLRCIKIGKFGLFHGHLIPDEEVLNSKVLILAHAHPSVLMDYGVKERVWVIGEWDGRKVIVMPAFNDLCASTPVNICKPAGFIFRRWNYMEAEAITLDGVLLGKIKNLQFFNSSKTY